MEAEGDAAETWVSTVGEKAAVETADASSGFVGAVDSFEATSGGCVTAAGDSAPCELVASIPAIAGLAAGEEEGEDSAFSSLIGLFAAATAVGIGLGSIAGLEGVSFASFTAASTIGFLLFVAHSPESAHRKDRQSAASKMRGGSRLRRPSSVSERCQRINAHRLPLHKCKWRTT